VKLRWLALLPVVIAGRALRVRLSVDPRRKYWHGRSLDGDLFLLALGDSLTQGIGSSRASTSWLGSFVAHIETTTGRAVRLENRAAYGAKVADVLALQLPLPPGADLVTLCIGANDAGRTEPQQFRADLRRVCGQLPPGSMVGDVPEFQWGPRVPLAAELASIVREVVAEYPGLILAEVEKYTAETRILTDLAGDFYHPNNAGYRRIARAFIQASKLDPLLTGDAEHQWVDAADAGLPK
jgi:acyl-CoA thioesterase-1